MESIHEYAQRKASVDALTAYTVARKRVPVTKREITREEAHYIYDLAKTQANPDSVCLEIGTALGFSAAVIAQAIHPARLVTLNPKSIEFGRAVRNLSAWSNVTILKAFSWEYLDWRGRPESFDFIFVDGDHGQVIRDLVWFNSLNIGGLILFHDYTPAGVKRACQPVVATLDAMREHLGRDFDVHIQDAQGRGIVGYVRRDAEYITPELTRDWQKHVWTVNGKEWKRRG